MNKETLSIIGICAFLSFCMNANTFLVMAHSNTPTLLQLWSYVLAMVVVATTTGCGAVLSARQYIQGNLKSAILIGVALVSIHIAVLGGTSYLSGWISI